MIESWCLSFSSLVHYMVRRKASLSSIPSHSLLLSCLSSPRILSVPTTQSEWREREKRWKGRKKGLHSYLLLSIPCHIIPAPKRWKWHEGMERRGKEWPSLSPVSVRSFLSLSFIWIIDGRERSEMESCLLSLPFSVPCHCYSFSLVTYLLSFWFIFIHGINGDKEERHDKDIGPVLPTHSYDPIRWKGIMGATKCTKWILELLELPKSRLLVITHLSLSHGHSLCHYLSFLVDHRLQELTENRDKGMGDWR